MKNDLAVAFYQLASLLTFLSWRKTGNFKWIQMGVFFAAMSAGVKHTALFGIIPLALLFLYAVWRQPRRMRAAISLGAVFVVFGLMWLARTWVLTGNPVYPSNTDTTVNVMALNPESHDGFEIYAIWPWHLHFQGRGHFHSFTQNPLGMTLVVILPVWLILRRVRCSRAERACYFFIAVFLLYWCNFFLVLRYAIAPFALLFLFAGARLSILHEASGKWIQASARLAASFCLLFALTVTVILEVNAPQFRYFTMNLDKEGFLREALLTYPSLEFLKGRAGPNDLVLGYDNCSRAYAPFPGQFSCSGENRFFTASEVLRRNLRALDYKYLILPDTPEFQAILAEVSSGQQSAQVFSDGVFAVHELTSLTETVKQ